MTPACAWDRCDAPCCLRGGRRVSYCAAHAARIYRQTKPYRLNGRIFDPAKFGEGVPVTAGPIESARREKIEEDATREARRALGLSDIQQPDVE